MQAATSSLQITLDFMANLTENVSTGFVVLVVVKALAGEPQMEIDKNTIYQEGFIMLLDTSRQFPSEAG